MRSLPDLYRLTKEQLLELDGYARDLGDERDRRDRGVEADPVPARPLRAEHPRSRLGDWRRTSRATSAPSTGCSPRARRRSWSATGSGRIAPRRSPSGSPTTTTARLVAELRALGLRFEVGRGGAPGRGAADRPQYVITGTLERCHARGGPAALEALGAKVSDNVSKKTTGVVVGESPGSKVAKAQKAGVPLLSRGRPAALLRARCTRAPSTNRSCALRARPRVDTGRRSGATGTRSGRRRSRTAPTRRLVVPSSRARRRAPGALMRSSSVPLTPATGSEPRTNGAAGRVVPGGDEQRRERARGQPVVERQARAVDDPHAGKRDARLAARSRGRLRRRRPSCPFAEPRRPSAFSTSSAVKLSLSRSICRQDRRERLRLDLRERRRVRRRAAGRDRAVDADAVPRRSRAEAPRRRAPVSAVSARRSRRGRRRAPTAAATRRGRTPASTRAPVRRASNHDSSASTRPSTRAIRARATAAASRRAAATPSVGSP